MLYFRLLALCFTINTVVSIHCHHGWTHYRGTCYGFGKTPATWPDANAICKAFDGRLAEPQTWEENVFLRTMARDKGAFFVYIGGTDAFNEGTWVWASTGKLLNGYPFSDWLSGDPNNYNGNEDCLVYYSLGAYHWVDIDCQTQAQFICEAQPMTRPVRG